MKLEEFSKYLSDYGEKIDLKFSKKQEEQFFKYMNLLIEWNEKINLTAIVEPKEIILKHFIDSLTINKYIEKASSIVDVGTGAGFPGIPLLIYRDDIKVTLVDSLNKRLIFLQEVINQLDLKNVKVVHSRVEDFGKNKNYREKFDIATARAVANLAVLSEYLVPLVKIGGKCICMKGSTIEDEIKQSENAFKILGTKKKLIEKFKLPNSDMERNIIILDKIKNTPSKYPRKAGIPTKEPII